METITSKALARYIYEPLLRPAGYATAPAGWEYVETPANIAHMRPDLPVSRCRHGLISYNRRLTAGELEQYDLRPVS